MFNEYVNDFVADAKLTVISHGSEGSDQEELDEDSCRFSV